MGYGRKVIRCESCGFFLPPGVTVTFVTSETGNGNDFNVTNMEGV